MRWILLYQKLVWVAQKLYEVDGEKESQADFLPSEMFIGKLMTDGRNKMANTYAQLYIQVVFAVQNRRALIHSSWEDDLYKYITGIVQNKGQKMLAINGMPDHIHLLISMRPSCCLSDLVREIKKSTSLFIKEKRLCRYGFCWQEGFGAFSYGQSQLANVIHYIANQKKHHLKVPFKKEFLDFLEKFKVAYKEDYLFDWLEDPK